MIAESQFSGRLWQGMRDYQEDSYLFCPLGEDALLVVLSDGMGGHQGGDIASKAAVENFVKECHEAGDLTDPPGLLRTALAKANAEVAKANEGRDEGELSGCTLVAALVSGNRFWFLSVGDSLLMLYRDGELYRLNKDHSMRAILQTRVLLGELSEEAYRKDRTKSMLLSALTGEEIELIDAPGMGRPLEEGDILLAASDGILTLEKGEITSICNQSGDGPVGELTRSLLRAVKEKAGPKQDNTTVTAFRHEKKAV